MIGQLLSVMKQCESNDLRIVLVSSDMHRWPGVDINPMNYSGEPAKYSMFNCYGRSKLYQVQSIIMNVEAERPENEKDLRMRKT